MSKVEVDPQLFIKCRLCLEDSGIYQIVPSVREQIIYCFDINVEPFDGLSQLICKKCESILCDYSKTKKSFIAKQEELKTKIRENNLPQEKIDGYSKPAAKRVNSEQTAKYVSKRRKIRELSTSSDEFPLPITEETNSSDDFVLPIAEESKKDWLIEYQKTFACRLCDTKLNMLKSAKEHQKLKHQTIKSKYAHYFKKYCLVVLPKINDKHNVTESTDKVVYSKHKIIGQCNSDMSALCYISYDYIGNKSNSFANNGSIKPVESANLDENSDSSSCISDARHTRRRRRRRICSRSSNETVVLEDKSNGNIQENDCINIDDTDSEDEKKKEKTNTKTKKCMNVKMNAVAKLITTTHNKYLKKYEKPEKPSTEQLNRKITSIGRQIINKRGFNSTRLSKYMEHLNLNIIWLARSPQNVTSNSNYFKIIPRWRYANEKNINHFDGYKKKYDKPKEVKTKEATLKQKTKTVKESSLNASPSTVKKKSSNAAPSIVESSQNQDHETVIYSGIENNDAYKSNKESDLNAASLFADTRILLNANPVANPRQLQKLLTSDAKKDKAKSAVTMATLEVKTNELSEVTSSGSENNTAYNMPIIAFTTSLAVAETQIDEPTNSSTEIPKPTAPRIKVKSVADLMSTETLNRMKNSTPPAPENQENNVVIFNGSGLVTENETLPKINNVRSISPASYDCDDYVILNTVELPNTKVRSPFKYFRTLLEVHNIILLDTDVTLSSDFKNIIRFKVLYDQDKEDPVCLCLSLCISGKMFCLKIKDRNNDNIDLSKISANWQWEILRIYGGDVVYKMLQNAEKISRETFENTNNFLCLLKSINRVPK